MYMPAVSFDTRKQRMRRSDGVTTWYSVVFNREGSKRSNEEDEVNARSGFTIKSTIDPITYKKVRVVL